MAAIKAGDVDRTIKSRPASVSVLLFYGPDIGRVCERAGNAARGFVDDHSDPFQLIRLDGDGLADRPGSLLDEAATYGLFGARRALWIRPTTRNIAAGISACLEAPLSDVLIVVEAGDLARTSPLRVACERSARAYALPCHGEDLRDLKATIDAAAREAGLSIDAAARDLLTDSLGGDSLATKAEMAKLVLYAANASVITVDDVLAVVSDVSATTIDAALDAAFLGAHSDLDGALSRLAAVGSNPAAILAATLRHTLSLMSAATALASGQTPDSAMRAWRGLHFRRQPAVTAQTRLWTIVRLSSLVATTQETVLQARRLPASAAAITAALLFEIADRAAKRQATDVRNVRHSPSS